LIDLQLAKQYKCLISGKCTVWLFSERVIVTIVEVLETGVRLSKAQRSAFLSGSVLVVLSIDEFLSIYNRETPIYR